jgi:hypothetical protein
MKYSRKARTEAVIGGRLATSAQPPRATSLFPSRLSPIQTAQALPPSLALRTNGAHQQRLGCCGLLPVLFGETVMGKPNRICQRVGQR